MFGANEPLRRFIRAMRSGLRINFFAGLLAAIPLMLTGFFFYKLWCWIDRPTASLFRWVHDVSGGWIKAPVQGDEYASILFSIFGLFFIIILMFLLGLIVRSILGHWLMGRLEWIVSKVPLAGTVYGSVKQIGQAVFSEDKKNRFQEVVMLQFPMPDIWSVGFVTGKVSGVLETATAEGAGANEERLTVFIPMAPLPTAGFLTVVPRSKVRRLPLTPADAFKLIVSGGIISPPDESVRLLSSVEKD
jgi:uncharacterized membrane protein